ncbi:MAG: RluA family pseudouridine synthase [Lachnospiraceae bacterium]|nr:RluA family pseudouridine synthase [Lachnospiraceae bacterium]
MRTEIIYEDDYVLVCYKPAALASQTARVGQPDVVSELRNYLNEKSAGAAKGYLGIVHRLDQPVEGLLVFARTQKAAAGLSAQLTGGTLNKSYYAVICGRPEKREAELTDYLEKKDGRAVVVRDSRRKGQRAVLHYKIIAEKEVLSCSVFLAEIKIDTGRFHQIRAQMANAGMPLLGDMKYGNEISANISRQLNVRNTALCAYELEFKHPVNGKKMHFVISPKGAAFGLFEGFCSY